MEKELSLLELSRLIKSTIEQNVGGPYWVVAEIGDLKVNQNGHCYLELVEKENNQVLAKARATIWANVYMRLAPYFAQASGERLKPGLKILCQVKPGFHEVFGLSLNILSIDPKYTVGERAKRREQIIKQLTEEGLVTLNKQLTWPLVPNRIAVISSETAAGYQDFMHQLQSNRYGYSYTTTLFQAIMQGDGAVSSISMALEEIRSQANQYDVLAILRGGGSSLDLDCFDSYELAKELAHFPLPVLTGIGHDKDSTVIDIVAYQSLKTPTALAEFLIQSVMQFEELLLTR
ncbi:MAG: exodeoxyribonuclease VII large subunit, partial [Cyclobacteriaceae bacterium]|nr:exodeoxyribonuclease VII large subunit [Cyclobacteriaceae bacterium]